MAAILDDVDVTSLSSPTNHNIYLIFTAHHSLSIKENIFSKKRNTTKIQGGPSTPSYHSGGIGFLVPPKLRGEVLIFHIVAMGSSKSSYLGNPNLRGQAAWPHLFHGKGFQAQSTAKQRMTKYHPQ